MNFFTMTWQGTKPGRYIDHRMAIDEQHFSSHRKCTGIASDCYQLDKKSRKAEISHRATNWSQNSDQSHLLLAECAYL